MRDKFFKKKCKLCAEGIGDVDYKDTDRLKDFTTRNGRIVSRKVNGNCRKHQNIITKGVKRARFMGLLPYSRD